MYHPILGFLSLHYRDAGIQSYNRHVNANDRAYGFRDKDKHKTDHFLDHILSNTITSRCFVLRLVFRVLMVATLKARFSELSGV